SSHCRMSSSPGARRPRRAGLRRRWRAASTSTPHPCAAATTPTRDSPSCSMPGARSTRFPRSPEPRISPDSSAASPPRRQASVDCLRTADCRAVVRIIVHVDVVVETKSPRIPEPVLRWLLDSDPAVRWQVLRDLANAPDEVVADERARVGREGDGARLLGLHAYDGRGG